MHSQLPVSQHCGKSSETGAWTSSHSPTADVFEAISRHLTLSRPHQGSFRCGECKPGFTGDQVDGCLGTRLCPNGKPNPCDANAECVVQRDGSIGCVVKTLRLDTEASASRNVLLHIRSCPQNVMLPLLCVSVLCSVASAGQVMATCVERTQILTHILT